MTYSYTYDGVGNITSVRENGVLRAEYYYDSLRQLGQSTYYSDRYYSEGYCDNYEFTYDKSGNITQVIRYYGVGVEFSELKTYTYGNTTWGDLLTNFNGTAITYDSIGNPTKWRNAIDIEWYGRQMSLFANNDGSIADYSYNADGIRTGKTLYDTDANLIGTTEYVLDGTKIVAEKTGSQWTYYLYDESGAPAGIIYDGELYGYRKNLQGDIVEIIHSEYNVSLVQYAYGPYGEVMSISGTMAATLGVANPFRYRGYYYDNETGLYYLQSRYYDPVVGRFLNADVIIGANGGILGYNSFAYCSNSPVNCVDPSGYICFPIVVIPPGEPRCSVLPCDTTFQGETEEEQEKHGKDVNIFGFSPFDFGFSLFDSDRFEDTSSWHDTIITVSGSGPSVDLENGNIGLGSVAVDGTTGGWEWKHGELKLFNFGHAEAGLQLKDGEFKMGAMASAWSPDASIDMGEYNVGLGAEVGSVGFGIYRKSSGWGFKIGLVIGISFEIEW